MVNVCKNDLFKQTRTQKEGRYPRIFFSDMQSTPIKVPYTNIWLKGYNVFNIINDVLSDPYDINAGVPQGSILGPTLFLLFINDMQTILTHCSIEMYADETRLYTLW